MNLHAPIDTGTALIGLPALAKLAFDGRDLAPVWNELVLRARDNPNDADALMDLSTVAHLQGRPDDRLALQAMALEVKRLYRLPPARAAARPLRLLALMAPGDFMANIPVEFMLDGAGIALDMLYIDADLPLPPLPEHDVALVAVAESRANQALLKRLAALAPTWPKPLLNAPDRIARLTREGTWELLKSAPGVAMPMNVDISRAELTRIAQGTARVEDILEEDTGFPIIARPADSHAGKGLEKLDNSAAVATYLATRAEREFSIAPFVDYRSADGLFRKARVALIAGKPYACHMAVSEHWMIHYLNADMRERPERRAEEARFFAEFDDFARRHSTALAAINERFGLDYIPFDCGETPDGKLLVFEAGTNMIVHSMDPPDLFPYKPPQMKKVFDAFQTMLRAACGTEAEAAVA